MKPKEGGIHEREGERERGEERRERERGPENKPAKARCKIIWCHNFESEELRRPYGQGQI